MQEMKEEIKNILSAINRIEMTLAIESERIKNIDASNEAIQKANSEKIEMTKIRLREVSCELKDEIKEISDSMKSDKKMIISGIVGFFVSVSVLAFEVMFKDR